MSHQSPYRTGLGTKVLNKAKFVLGSLLLLFTIFTISAIYQGIVSDDFDKVLVKPFQQLAVDLQKAAESTPAPIPSLMPVPTISNSTSTSSSTTKVIINQAVPAPTVKKTQPIATNCIRMNIREGEFASNKCYSQQDYEDLSYYLNQYNSAVSSVSFYETKVRISCGNNDFFKTCEQDKKEQQTNLDNIPRYRSIIQGIVAKGK